jgi:hypothetical protein
MKEASSVKAALRVGPSCIRILVLVRGYSIYKLVIIIDCFLVYGEEIEEARWLTQ